MVKSVPDGLEFLAVRAPGRVELDEPWKIAAFRSIHDLVEVMNVELLRLFSRLAWQVLSFGFGAEDRQNIQSK